MIVPRVRISSVENGWCEVGVEFVGVKEVEEVEEDEFEEEGLRKGLRRFFGLDQAGTEADFIFL